MLNLYYSPICPYCNRVLLANEKIGARLNLLDVTAGLHTHSELIAKGGKGQVPYLEDSDRGISMYESADIIDYLAKHYSSGNMPNVSLVDSICPID